MRSATALRNSVAHRHLMDDWEIRYDASCNDEPARRLAVVEVCRRKGIETDPSDSPKRELSSVSPLSRSDTGSR